MDANNKVSQMVEPRRDGDVVITILQKEQSEKQLPPATAAAASAPVDAVVANGGSASPPPVREVGTYRLERTPEWVHVVGAPVDVAIANGDSASRPPYRLERIPEWVRVVNSDAYSPRFISIGPIHRPKDGDDPALHCTDLKNDYLRRITELDEDEYGLRRLDKDACLRDLKEMEAETRSFYAQDFKETIKEEEWAQMLLHDGCFVVMFLVEFNLGIGTLSRKLPKWAWSALKMDLILLENQLPFCVLKCIMRLVLPKESSDNEVAKLLAQLVIYYWVWRRGFDEVEKLLGHEDFRKVEHLLHVVHLAHYRMIYGYKDEDSSGGGTSGSMLYGLIIACIWKTRSAICYSPILVMKLLSWPCIKLCQFVDPEEEEEEDKVEEEEVVVADENNIPSATQLHNLGINFRRKKHLRLGPKSIYEVGINAMDNNTLDIPRLVVSSSEEPLLHNLIAWEHSAYDECAFLEYDEEGHFTKYAFLMYNLINDTQDIALLQRNGILLNKIGTDDEVVAYFKRLVQYTSLEPKKPTTSSQTRLEMVMNFWLCKKSSDDERSKIDQVMEVLQHRVEQPEYVYWAEVKKYFDSPLKVLLLLTSFLVFVGSAILPAIMSAHTTK